MYKPHHRKFYRHNSILFTVEPCCRILGYPRMNSRNTTKMVEHKLTLFATVRILWTLVTLLIKLFRILLKWKYIQDQNYTILAAIW